MSNQIKRRLSYDDVLSWAQSVNGRIAIGVDLGPVSVGQLVQLIHDQHEALSQIHKISLCPEPKRMRDWSARVDVMADFARKAINKTEV